MKSQEYSAKTVALATEQGLSDLGVSKEQATVEILAQGGLFAKAKVRITVLETTEQTSSASAEEIGLKAQSFLTETLRRMGIDSTVTLSDSASEITLEVNGEESKELFMRRGETVDALQYLTSLISNAGQEEYRRIVLDSEHYRLMRQARLESIADEMAAKAIERGYRIKLEPMNPYERRIIHTRLAERTGEITTHSEGDEPNRFLVITPVVTKAKSYEPKEEATSDYSSRPHGDRSYHPHGEQRSDRRGGYAPRNNSDRPASDRPRNDRPAGGRPFGDRPRNDRPAGDRPFGDRPRNDRPRGDRPFGDRPPKPPRKEPTFIGTILTTPIKPKDEE